MLLQKTEKAHAELAPGVRTLGLRERSALLLADGHKTREQLLALLGPAGEVAVARLVADGYLAMPEPAIVIDLPLAGSHAPAAAATRPAADTHPGNRSLAGTRMFLFDICERLFARRDAEQAEFFRMALREARDRESMLIVAQEMMDEVARLAGRDRADAIAERITALLPDGEPLAAPDAMPLQAAS